MSFAAILSVGTYSFPVLIIEKFFSKDDGFENTAEYVYKNFVKDLRFSVEKHNIIIYREWNKAQKFIYNKIRVKNDFIQLVNKTGLVRVEFHVYVLDFDKKPTEMFFLECFLFSHKPPEDISFKKKPRFHVKDKKGNYISFFKRKVIC